MLSRVQFSRNDYDSPELRPYAPGRRNGVHRLRSLIIAGERIHKKVNEADLPPDPGTSSAESCGAIVRLRNEKSKMSLLIERLLHRRWLLLPPFLTIDLCPLVRVGIAPDIEKLR